MSNTTKQREAIVRGPTLASCMAVAVAQLGAPADQIMLGVLSRPDQREERPVFVARAVHHPPSQVEAEHSSEFARRVTQTADGILQRNAVAELLGDEGDQEAELQAMVEQFDQLDEELKRELAILAEIQGSEETDAMVDRIRRDGTCTVTLTENDGEARVSITPPVAQGKPATSDEVRRTLAAAGVTCGINDGLIEQICTQVVETMAPCREEVVAVQRAPSAGSDGYVEFVRNGQEMRAEELIAWQNRKLPGDNLWSCKQNDVVARIVPPTPGSPGATVRGDPIPAPPADEARMHAGKNVRFDADSGAFVADVDGLVVLKGDYIEAETIYVVYGDVCVGTGNVTFDGQVWVTGSVRDGYRVRAGGDVTIDGGVEAAEVSSSRGGVLIRQGIQGRFRAFVKAAVNVTAKYIENANVLAGGNVVSSAIIRSNLTAGGAVIAMTGKGTIFGGNIRACQFVRAKVLGAPAKIRTEIVLGMSLAQQQEVFEFDRQIATLANVLEELEDLAKSFSRAAAGSTPLTDKERQTCGELHKKIVLAKYRLGQAAKEKERLLHKVELQTGGSVQVGSLLYPGATVRIGSAVFRTDVEIKTCTLHYDNEKQAIARADYRET